MKLFYELLWYLQTILSWGTVVTLRTLEWFLRKVMLHVSSKMTVGHETAATIFTNKGSTVGVMEHVLLEMRLLGRGICTSRVLTFEEFSFKEKRAKNINFHNKNINKLHKLQLIPRLILTEKTDSNKESMVVVLSITH